MIYDAVLCVSPRHKAISLKAIRSLCLFSQPRRLYVITARQHFAFFETELEKRFPICLLDEDQIIENVSLRVIQETLLQRIGLLRQAGWYLQQFVKMAACNMSDLADYYLVWDSDTLLLHPLDFFDQDGRVLVNPTTEHHKPYFDLMQRLLGIKKQVDYSFISEHFMINKAYMKELLSNLMTKSPGGASWVNMILNSIHDRHIGSSGFSEFETYGNFVTLNYKDSLKCRVLKSTRFGTVSYGKNPSKCDLLDLMLRGYVFASFEAYHGISRKRLILNKPRSRIQYAACYLANRHRKLLDATVELCR